MRSFTATDSIDSCVISLTICGRNDCPSILTVDRFTPAMSRMVTGRSIFITGDWWTFRHVTQTQIYTRIKCDYTRTHPSVCADLKRLLRFDSRPPNQERNTDVELIELSLIDGQRELTCRPDRTKNIMLLKQDTHRWDWTVTLMMMMMMNSHQCDSRGQMCRWCKCFLTPSLSPVSSPALPPYHPQREASAICQRHHIIIYCFHSMCNEMYECSLYLLR